MASAARRTKALIGLTAAALALAACSGNGHPAKANGAAAVSMVPAAHPAGPREPGLRDDSHSRTAPCGCWPGRPAWACSRWTPRPAT